MSVKVDIGKSNQSRTDGNTSFKKGRWSEAIGHYTNAIIYNPTNPVNYSNRAQAFLKIDKYQDAERDCTTCLSLEQNNIKALYRRGLARKGLGKVDEAIVDLQQILKIDKTNETVKSELEELENSQRNNEIKKSKPRRPITPPPVNATSKSTEASIEEIADQTDSIDLSSSSSSKPKVNIPDTPKEQNTPNTSTPSSFASLKQAREGKKKAFVNGTNVSPTTLNEKASISSMPTLSIKTPHASVTPTQSTNPTSSQPQNPLTVPTSSRPEGESLSLPTDIDINSTSPGAGLIFLRHLSSSHTTTSVRYNWELISLYSPEVLSKILVNLLEPDNLGLILIALEYGLELNQEQEEKVRVKGLLDGLKKSKRWKMNYSMLSHQERTIGDKVWKECGGEGGLR
ncbi:hypothetical protein V865_004091 [Kwoniella europaea PYCC6329]|uniref:RNA polymerase II-associated protein 3 n=1 Tax=Kwoniella europaea PYCC6329 TaxID=1423913 RepID=A0AAX4KHM3_9TREE